MIIRDKYNTTSKVPEPDPKVDRKGQPYYTTDQPIKPVERACYSSGVVRATLRSHLSLVRMGGDACVALVPFPSRLVPPPMGDASVPSLHPNHPRPYETKPLPDSFHDFIRQL